MNQNSSPSDKHLTPSGQRLAPTWLAAGILVCFFLSGLTSLALETAWSKSLSYLLGTDLYGAATTIVAYMAGLGLGALLASRLAPRLRQPLLSYSWLQVAIGVAGLVSIPVLLSTQPVFEWFNRLSDNRALFLTGRFLVTFGLLLPATTLMGMTLPVVIGAYNTAREDTPASAGLLYGVNTLGAVAGTLLAGYWWIPQMGLRLTCIVVGLVDLAIALLVYGVYRGLDGRQGNLERTSDPDSLGSPATEEPALAPEPRASFRARVSAWGIELPVLLAGVTALALEVCWFRLLGQIIGPSVQALAVTLAVFLLGIGLGSLTSSRLLRFFPSGDAALATFLFATVALAMGPVYYLDRVPGWYVELWSSGLPFPPETSLVITQGLIGCLLMLPATLASGAVFPAAIRAMRERCPQSGSIATVSGRLFFVNTIGAVLGTLIWAFALIPKVGMLPSIQLATAVSLIGGLIVFSSGGQTFGGSSLARGKRSVERSTLGGRVAGQGAIALLLGATILFVPPPEERALYEGVFYAIRSKDAKNKFLARPMAENAKILFARDGLNASVTVVQGRFGTKDLDLALSGKWVAGTHPHTRRSLTLLGHLPMLLAKKDPKTALVIGLGTGITSGSLLTYPGIESLDIVELEPAVAEASDFFIKYNHAPLADPRTRLILQDGRTYIGFGSKRYDLITSDPIHPWVKGAANLYTHEYYIRARERLEPGGIFCQWIPTSLSADSFYSILRTLRAAFPEVGLMFAVQEVVALASHEPIDFDLETVRRRMESDPKVAADLQWIRLDEPERMVSMLDKSWHHLRGRKRTNKAVLNTDDNVFLEHRLPWDMFYGEMVRLQRKAKTKPRTEAKATKPRTETD